MLKRTMGRISAFIGQYYAFEVFAVIGIVAVCIALVIAMLTKHKKEYIKAPIESCQEASTGNKRQETVLSHYQCFAFDDKGNCTMNIPQYQDVTRVEVQTWCSWKEWR